MSKCNSYKAIVACQGPILYKKNQWNIHKYGYLFTHKPTTLCVHKLK